MEFLAVRTLNSCLQDGSSGEDFNKDSIERDERRLTELGRRTVEIFVLAHIFRYRVFVISLQKPVNFLVGKLLTHELFLQAFIMIFFCFIQ